jgi:hypothetical protein
LDRTSPLFVGAAVLASVSFEWLPIGWVVLNRKLLHNPRKVFFVYDEIIRGIINYTLYSINLGLMAAFILVLNIKAIFIRGDVIERFRDDSGWQKKHYSTYNHLKSSP